MGTISTKRGGSGGRNVPPMVLAPFVPFGGNTGKPVQAVIILVSVIFGLAFLGLLVWGTETVLGKKWFDHEHSEMYYRPED